VAGSVRNCPQTLENPPQLQHKEKSNTSQTTEQAKHITDSLSETNQQTTWLSNSRINPSILNVLISMENNGNSKGVINSTRKELSNLAGNADLTQPDEVKTLIAKMKTGNAYKRMLVQAYNRYTKYYKIIWEAPKYKVTSREISVPTDDKIKMLISASKKPLSTKLQLSYETGLRPVEVCELKVKDFNTENKIIHPKTAKNGAPRQLKISDQLTNLINEQITKNNLAEENYIFGGKPEKYSYSFQRVKTMLSKRLNDPEIKRIRLYDLRHKFCMNTIEKFPQQPFLIMYTMGHKHLNTTEHYVHIQEYIKTINSTGKYLTATASTVEQAIPLIEQGYIQATEFNGIKIFKKPK
jgi:integrase